MGTMREMYGMVEEARVASMMSLHTPFSKYSAAPVRQLVATATKRRSGRMKRSMSRGSSVWESSPNMKSKPKGLLLRQNAPRPK